MVRHNSVRDGVAGTDGPEHLADVGYKIDRRTVEDNSWDRGWFHFDRQRLPDQGSPKLP